MSARPGPQPAGLGVALAILEPRDRVLAVLIAALGTFERGVLVCTALALGADDRRRTVLLGVVLAVSYAVRSLLRGTLRARLQRQLHRRAADAVLGGDPLVATPLGDDDAEVVLLDGVHHGSILLAERLPALAGDAVASVLVLVYLAFAVPSRVLLVGAAGLVFAAVAGIAARRTTARAQDASWAAYRPLLDRMLFAIRGRMELVANGADSSFGTELDGYLETFERTTRRADRLAAVASRAPLVAGAVGVVVAILSQGGGDGLVGGAALADAALFASVVPAFVGLAQNGHEAWRLSLLFRPMSALLSIPPATATGTEAPPGVLSPIVLRDVTYRYPGASKDALAGVSLSFEKGEPLVLSGANGSGKSTVLRLLAALGAPARGSITAGGVDLSAIDAKQWRTSVAYLPQQPQLPETFTVSAAVRLLVPNASDTAIRDALARVDLLDVLSERAPSDPLSVKIAVLSTGQRKRVAIARVLLGDARLVLLDEPDASLDADGVKMVARVARELASTRLVAIAAHTPAIVSSPGVHVELAA